MIAPAGSPVSQEPDVFKRFFKHAKQSETIDRGPTTGRESEISRELAMRASIANKLRNYNSDEDTTISNFTLADDETEKTRYEINKD